MARPTASAEVEDRLFRLRDENGELKQRANEQADVIKRLKTKLVVLEESLRRAGVGEAGSKYIEAQETIARQAAALDQLQKRCKALEGKLRVAEEALLRRRPVSSSGGAAGASGGGVSVRRSVGGVESARRAFEAEREGRADGRGASEELLASQRTVSELQTRILTLETRLRERTSMTGGMTGISGGGMSGGVHHGALELSSATDSAGRVVGGAVVGVETLRAKEAENAVLRARVERLEAHGTARAELHERISAAFEEQSRALREREAALQRAEAENASLSARVESLREAERRRDALELENRELEGRLEQVLTTPFFGQAQGAGSRWSGASRAEVEEELRRLQEAVGHLRGTVKGQEAELESSQRERRDLQSRLEDARLEASKLRDRLQAASQGTDALRAQLALYAGVDGLDSGAEVPLRDLEEALAIVRRKRDRPQHVDFLANPTQQEGAEDAAEDASDTRRKLREARALAADAQQGKERAERLLRTARAYTVDLEEEVRELRRRLRSETAQLAAKADAADELARKKEDVIRNLRGQVDALLQEQRVRRAQTLQNPPLPASSSQTSELPASGVALAAGEAMLEVWVQHAELQAGVLGGAGAAVPTFVTLEFADFETQASGVVRGTAPAAYNFCAAFPCVADDALLRSCAMGGCALDVCAVGAGDVRLVGGGTVLLHHLLFSPSDAAPDKGQWTGRVPLFTPNGASLGYANVLVRTSVPLGPAWRRFAAQFPEQAAALQSWATSQDTQQSGNKKGVTETDADSASSSSASSAPYISVEVSEVTEASAGPSTSPSSLSRSIHVEYTLSEELWGVMGTEGAVAVSASQQVGAGGSALLTDVRPFALPTHAAALETLRLATMRVAVWRDAGGGVRGSAVRSAGGWRAKSAVAEPAVEGDELVGVASVSLAPLARGQVVQGEFPLANRPDVRVRVRIGWEPVPLRPSDQLPAHEVLADAAARAVLRFAADPTNASPLVRWEPLVDWWSHASDVASAAVTRLRFAVAAANIPRSTLASSLTSTAPVDIAEALALLLSLGGVLGAPPPASSSSTTTTTTTTSTLWVTPRADLTRDVAAVCEALSAGGGRRVWTAEDVVDLVAGSDPVVAAADDKIRVWVQARDPSKPRSLLRDSLTSLAGTASAGTALRNVVHVSRVLLALQRTGLALLGPIPPLWTDTTPSAVSGGRGVSGTGSTTAVAAAASSSSSSAPSSSSSSSTPAPLPTTTTSSATSAPAAPSTSGGSEAVSLLSARARRERAARWERTPQEPVPQEESTADAAGESLRGLAERLGGDETPTSMVALSALAGAWGVDAEALRGVCAAVGVSVTEGADVVDAAALLWALEEQSGGGASSVSADRIAVERVRWALRAWSRSQRRSAAMVGAEVGVDGGRSTQDAVTATSLLEGCLRSTDESGAASVVRRVLAQPPRALLEASAAQLAISSMQSTAPSSPSSPSATLAQWSAWLHCADSSVADAILSGRALAQAVHVEVEPDPTTSTSATSARRDGVMFAGDILAAMDRKSDKDRASMSAAELARWPAADASSGLSGVVTGARGVRTLAAFFPTCLGAADRLALLARHGFHFETHDAARAAPALVRYGTIADSIERAASALRKSADSVGVRLRADNDPSSSTPSSSSSSSEAVPLVWLGRAVLAAPANTHDALIAALRAPATTTSHSPDALAGRLAPLLGVEPAKLALAIAHCPAARHAPAALPLQLAAFVAGLAGR